jgi:catechol 2,3-dioxygenase-like lactoylglutathione lyase family enzyme
MTHVCGASASFQAASSLTLKYMKSSCPYSLSPKHKSLWLSGLVLTLLLFACGTKIERGNGTLEIGLVCSDLGQSLAFYRDVIGMKEVGGFEVDGAFSTDIGLSDGKPFKVRLLKLEDSPDATTLKLACCSDTTAAARPRFVSDMPGVRYITIEVKSTKSIKEKLRQRGVPLLGKTPVSMGDDQELLMCLDPDGVFVEIIGSKH